VVWFYPLRRRANSLAALDVVDPICETSYHPEKSHPQCPTTEKGTMIAPALRTQPIGGSDVLAMQREAGAIAARGQTVYRFVQGEPDFDTPAHIVEAAMQALRDGYTHYPPSEGYLELREAIAAKLARENDLEVDPASEVIVTNGAGLGLYLAIMAVVDDGDEVILSDPTYGPYRNDILLAGGIPVLVPQQPDAQGRPRWDIGAVAAAITPKTRVIVINTPANPTGAVMSRDELQGIADIAVRHDLVIISDEVYEKLVFDDARHVSIATLSPEVAQRTITVNSFSKTYAMTGWRLGYNVAAPGLVATMEKVNSVCGRAAAAFVQRAGIAALNGPQQSVTKMVDAYGFRRSLVEDQLREMPSINWISPQGAFYVFLDVSAFGRDSRELAMRMLRDAHVVLTPGTYYGPAGAGWLRLSFSASPAELTGGLERLHETLARWSGA
jgi:aspartate/methionine/tyrosine aminotransferase